MKILYVCGTYAPGAFAGSELSAHELLRGLHCGGSANVLVVTDVRYTGGRPRSTEHDGVPVVGVRHEDRSRCIREILKDFEPDVILTQLMWSDVAVSAGKASGVPTVLRIPSKAPNLDLVQPTALAANSRFICDWVRERSGRECSYIFSTIDLDRVVAPASARAPRFITMFNPLKHKGGRIFREIARAMPETEFAVVPGWHSLRKEDGTWDLGVIARSLESARSKNPSWKPKDVRFSEVANVEVLKPTHRVSEIFAQTRILLVPSQYEETLARVSIEAFANGIPVIGSNVGGLKDHIRKAGILVEDYSEPAAWISAIRTLDCPERYAEYSRKGLGFITNEFSNERTADAYLALFESLGPNR